MIPTAGGESLAFGFRLPPPFCELRIISSWPSRLAKMPEAETVMARE
jgi:hypothetical protein